MRYQADLQNLNAAIIAVPAAADSSSTAALRVFTPSHPEKIAPPSRRLSKALFFLREISTYILFVTWQQKISEWQKLSPAERKERRWKSIPQQVAASMAFENEPVDLEWLKALHSRRTPRAL